MAHFLGAPRMTAPPVLRILRPDEIDAHAPVLGAILVACVEGGASIGFVRGVTVERAALFWRDVAASARRDHRAVILAADGADIIGVVQLIPAGPDNQPHRADVSKMLVHPKARRRGVGALLMDAAHDAARRMGRTLLVLDTQEHSDAERLYARMGWTRAGVIPDYAFDSEGKTLIATVLYWKRVD